MIKHIVLMKFKPDTDEGKIAEVEKGLGTLPGIIPEIKSYEFGRDVMKSERSYDFALVSGFENMDSLKRYSVHPEHQKVLALILAACEDIKAVDYQL